MEANSPRCPHCGSTSTRRSDFRQRSFGAELLHFVSPWYRCNDCANKFRRVDSLALLAMVSGLLFFVVSGSLVGWAIGHVPEAQIAANTEVARIAAAWEEKTVQPVPQVSPDELRQSAAAGDAEAQFLLGMQLFENTWTGAQSSEVAASVAWLVKAAEQGHADANFLLGALHDKGRGVIQNYAEALSYYSKAAAQGHPLAMARLGKLLVDGWGVEQNLVNAYVWLNLAAARGATDAALHRDALQRKLTPQQLAEAQERSRDTEAALPLLANSVAKLPLGL